MRASDEKEEDSQRQAELLSDIIGISNASHRARIAELIHNFRLLKLSISDLKLNFDSINPTLFYALYFFDNASKQFTHKVKWTDDENLFLINAVFRHGISWSDVAVDLFSDRALSESCRKRYYRILTMRIYQESSKF